MTCHVVKIEFFITKKAQSYYFLYRLKTSRDMMFDFMTRVIMNINEQFAAAQIAVKNLSEKPGNLDLLALYANYKQATDGDADGNRPSMTDFIARAKYDAWAALAGTQPEEKKQKYIELVNRLVEQDA